MRCASVFVIHNEHHNNFKLCNSNLERSICHSAAAIHPSNRDEKKSFFIDFPPAGVGGGKMKEVFSNESDFQSESNLAMNVKESEMIADGFWACRDHSTSDTEKGKVSMNKFAHSSSARSDLKISNHPAPSLSHFTSTLVFALK